jgi:CRISPR system Cascade subunit CasA
MAPDAGWNGHDWDRLALFTAMLSGNADVAAVRAAIVSAEGARRAAGARPGPALSLTGEYAGKAPEASPWLFGAALDFPIDAGGRRSSRLTVADLAIAAARYDYAEAIWTVRMALRRALADRLLADRRLAASDALLVLRQRQFAVVSRRVAAGSASRADLERVRSDTADATRRQGDARAAIIVADAGIAATLGVPVGEIAGRALRWDDFETPAPQPIVDAAQRLAALTGRADVLKATTLYDQAEANLLGEIARQYPAISIGPGYTWERGLVKIPVNLALVLPPLDGNRGAIAAAEARRAEAGANVEASVAGAAAAIDLALADTRQARAQLALVRGGELPAAERLALQAENELAAGAIDRGEWAAAQAGAGLARLSELDALAAVHAADAGLEAALRRPIDGPELAIRGKLVVMR